MSQNKKRTYGTVLALTKKGSQYGHQVAGWLGWDSAVQTADLLRASYVLVTIAPFIMARLGT